ncbi:hypothetical protein WICMUC_001935 [Wickerhamomyces mucosus]|uniref:U3 small nucleolar RNA-associated protein 25 n=1 Tax=Wickerhamomyces mucosus TaxID=1378264 RepID=A0A9P8TFM5_9ASCO|nr:hypothetical protein WICMUC_001935 [Wickerhamomyces mucosus]
MGSSDARKQRRRKADCESVAVNQLQERKRSKPNRGRTEYRNVVRTAKRKPIGDKIESNDEEDENLEFPEHTDLEDNDSDDEIEEKGKAYDALLTLLQAENESDPESDSQEEEGVSEDESGVDERTEDQSEDSEEKNTDNIAGLVADEGIEEDEEFNSADEEDIDSEDESSTDPFESHFANSSEEYLKESISALSDNPRWKTTKKLFNSHSCIVSLPPNESSAKYAKIPNNHSLASYNIKNKILEPFLLKDGNAETVDNSEIFQMLLDPMFSYNDIIFPYNSHKKIPEYRKLYSLHVLNHIYKTRDRILKNNTKLSIQNEKISNGELKPEEEKEFRDQGFTRPKVLILLPTRHQCYKAVSELLEYSGVDQIENFKKFKGQFLDRDSIVPENKSDDFRDLFEGNTNDFFCLGLKFTRKSAKLYSSFYNSDIIFASPIGLQLILENPDKKKRQTDFLSSIEIFIVDEAQAIELQNWDHILTVLKYLNQVPKELHDTDFGRTRMWSIEDQSKYFTQSLIFTEYNTPNINNLLSRSKNIFGKYRFKSLIEQKDSAMYKLGLKIKQIFTRFQSTSPLNEPDERFNHFKSVIVPSLTKSTSYEDGLLFYIPSYTDFVRIKNYLNNKTSLSFCDVNEYSEQKDLSRSRALFQQGRSKILLYTERLHHYRRFELKGVKNVFLYGVPNNPIFYTEIVSSIARSVYDEIADFNISSVRCLYSKWDALALERIVSSERAPVLTHGQNEFYEFR